MDLRIVKTRRQIKKAFLKLRARLMPENIKVKDICDEAQINKTTFYKHYNDSMELSNEIDDSTIENVVSRFPDREMLFESPKEYILSLLKAMEMNADSLRTVFRGKPEVLCLKLEERLHNFFADKAKSYEDGIKISFAVGGFVRVVNDHIFNGKIYDIDRLVDYTVTLLEPIVRPRHRAAAL